MTEQRKHWWSRAATAVKERVIDASSGAGALRSDSSVAKYDAGKLKSLFEAAESDIIQAYLNDLVESTVGNGYYTTVEKVSEVRETNRAKKYIDEFGRVQNLDSLMPNICRITLIAGYCPVENILVDGPPDKQKLKIIHPLTIREDNGIETNPVTGEVTAIHQKVGTRVNDITKPGTIGWFNHNPQGNDPRGQSLVANVIPIVNELNSAVENVNKIIKRYIGPLGIWKSTGPIDAIKAAVTIRQPGEDIFLGNLKPDDIANPNFPQFISIDPRVPFWEYVEYLDRRVYNAMRANSTWYSRNATEASANVIDDIVLRQVKSIQRDMKRGVERYWFAPLVELNGLPEIPRLNFGVEATGVQDIQVEPFLTKGLELGYIDDAQFNDILKQLGVKMRVQPEKKEEEPAEEKPTNGGEGG